MISKQTCGKILLCAASAFLAAAVAVAQTQPGGGAPQQQQQPMPSQQTPGSNTGSMSPSSTVNDQQAMIDQAFVRKALDGGNTEVQLGQLAQQKSQSDDVKQFGQKMVQDHTQLGEQMKPIAQQLGVKESKGPSKKDKQLMAKLEAMSGQQFDEAYIKAMVKDHKQDLKDFKDEAQMTQNPAIKQTAQQGAELISQHLQMIQQIAQNHNVATDNKSKSKGASGMQ